MAWTRSVDTNLLKYAYASTGSLIGTIISLTAAYFHMHSFCSSSLTSLRRVHHVLALFVLFGLSSITWSGHCIHIAYPANGLLLKDCPEMLFGYPQPYQGIGLERLCFNSHPISSASFSIDLSSLPFIQQYLIW